MLRALVRLSRIESLRLMNLSQSHRRSRQTAWMFASIVAAIVLLTPALIVPARAQAANAGQTEGVAPATPQSSVPQKPFTIGAVSTNASNPQEQKTFTAKTIDKVKEVAKSASDIFSRVPCLPPKGGAKSMGSLPHVA